MTKQKELDLLNTLKDQDSLFSASVSDADFNQMIANIKDDHPLFLKTGHDADHHASLTRKIEELESMLREKNQTIEVLEQQVEKHSNRADDSIQQFERIAKKLTILTRVTSKAINPDNVDPQLRIELKTAYGTLPLTEDETECILAKYWNDTLVGGTE
jgi:septal ring factor EnvC (AmiA/AmiB activator)